VDCASSKISLLDEVLSKSHMFEYITLSRKTMEYKKKPSFKTFNKIPKNPYKKTLKQAFKETLK